MSTEQSFFYSLSFRFLCLFQNRDACGVRACACACARACVCVWGGGRDGGVCVCVRERMNE